MTAGATASRGISRQAQRPLVVVPMMALGGGADDWPSVIGQANAIAGKGAVQLLPGNGAFKCAAPVELSSRAIILGRPDVEIVSTMTDSGVGPQGFLKSVFRALGQLLNAPTTLAATPAGGALQVSVTADVAAVDDHVAIYVAPSALQMQCFKVLAKSGVGPFVYTLDAPVEFAFAAGDAVQKVDMATGIEIIGNGMSVTGTGDRAVELSIAERCYVSDLRVTRAGGSFTSIACSFDVGGRFNVFERLDVDGGDFSAACLALESNFASSISGSLAYRTKDAASCLGIFMPSGRRCLVSGCTVWAAKDGIWLGPSDVATETEACRRCTVTACTVSNCTAHGVVVVGGDVTLEGIVSTHNTESGVLVDSTTAGGAATVRMSDIDASDNRVVSTVGGGVYVHGAGASVVMSDVTAHRNADGAGLFVDGAGASVVAAAFEADDGIAAIEIMSASCSVVVNGFRFRRVGRNATWIAAFVGAASSLVLDGGSFELAGGSGTSLAAQTVVDGARLQIDNARSVGNLTIGVDVIGAGHIIRGDVDFSSIATVANRWILSGTCLANFGQFIANGATPVPVAGYFEADQPIAISLNTAGGAPGPEPTLATKAANAFTVVAAVGDTSLYDWKAT